MVLGYENPMYITYDLIDIKIEFLTYIIHNYNYQLINYNVATYIYYWCIWNR